MHSGEIHYVRRDAPATLPHLLRLCHPDTRAARNRTHHASRERFAGTGHSAQNKEFALSTAPHKGLRAGSGTFFEPPEAFTSLKACVVEDLLERAAPKRPARIWMPACATGEEAYSIAMLLIEHFRSYGREPNVRIFATDAEATRIKVARAGAYAESALAGVSG